MLRLRPTTAADHDAVWAILEPILRAGETYALPRDIPQRDALAYWFAPGHETVVAEADGVVCGAYYLRANQAGGGDHVANCGFMTAPVWAGRGIARAMCVDAQARAWARGFRAMQFNFVVSVNTRAVTLWTSMGFETVGRLPGAFRHPTAGEVDALVMFKRLTPPPAP